MKGSVLGGVELTVGGLDARMDDLPKLQDENTDAILSRTGGGDFGEEPLELDSPPISGEACVVGGDEDVLASVIPAALSVPSDRGGTVEKRDARCEMNDPILAPQVFSVAFVSDAACVATVAADIDKGFKCGFAFGLGLRAGDVEFVLDKSELGERKKESCDEDLLRPPPMFKSECVISTGVLEVLEPASFPREDELTDR